MPVLTDVPDDLTLRGIPPAETSHAFAISLDQAEPWGGGRFEGRVERRGAKRDDRVVVAAVRCWSAWLDVAPQLVGKKKILRLDTYWDLRMRALPIWLEDEAFSECLELGGLDEVNWRTFSFDVPGGLPRAVEGTFVSFRWRVEVSRARRIGHERASLPILLREPQTLPVVRVETSPLGTWRLLEWKSEEETTGEAGACRIDYEERRPEDMPPPGATRESERAGMFGGKREA